MKALVILILLLLALLGAFLVLKPGQPPAPQPAGPDVPPAAAGQPSPGPVQVTEPATRQPGIVGDLHQAADYATGVTQVRVKKRMEQKIQAISTQHNAALEEEANR